MTNDFARTRPHWPRSEKVLDFVQQAREEGASIVQDFHESMAVRGGRLYAIIADVCAFANTNGGTLYVGLSADPKKAPVGVSNSSAAVRKLRRELSERISPPLQVEVDTQKTARKTILRLLIPRGEDPPYAVDDNKIYVRDETETGLAVRDEIVQLVVGVRRALESQMEAVPTQAVSETSDLESQSPPRTGVEVVEVEERNGTRYYTLRDLRNGNVVKNVTHSSARRLWHYAISQFRQLPDDKSRASITWQGELGLLKEQKRGGRSRYDLAQRTSDGIRFYYGVTEDGIHGDWRQVVGNDRG